MEQERKDWKEQTEAANIALEKRIRNEEADIRRAEESALKRRIREEIAIENEIIEKRNAAQNEELSKKLAKEE